MESLAQLLGGAGMRTVTNVAVPLACEWLGARDAPQDAGLRGDDTTGLWSICVDALGRGVAGSRYVSPAVAAAAEEALAGFNSPPERAEAAAAAALKLSPLAADAHNLRALRCAGSLEEALELYRTAVGVARQAFKPSTLDELRGDTAAWDIPELRPLVRAMHGARYCALACLLLLARSRVGGMRRMLTRLCAALHAAACAQNPAGVANTLRKLRRWREARAAYEALDALDPGSHFRSSAWTNWKAHYPDVLLACGDAAAARAFVARPDNSEGTEYESSALHWAASLALYEGVTCGFAAAAETEGGWPSAFLARPFDPNTPCDEAVLQGGGAAACVLCKRYSHAVALLVGAAPMPAGRMRAQLSGVLGRVHDTPVASAIWAAGAQPIWETVPGALAWLRRMHHIFQLHASLRGAPLISDKWPPAPLDVPAAVALIKRNGVYANASFGSEMNHETLVHDATFAQAPPVLRALLAAGASAVPPRAQWAPLFRAAYIDAPAPVLKALLSAMPRGHPVKRDAADVAAQPGQRARAGGHSR
jgi:tetratricopeptide (TPR) repeat protein